MPEAEVLYEKIVENIGEKEGAFKTHEEALTQIMQ